MCHNRDAMKVRTVLLATALICGLTALAEAKAQSPAAAHAKAMVRAQKLARKRGKARMKAIQKRSNIKRQAVIHPAPKH